MCSACLQGQRADRGTCKQVRCCSIPTHSTELAGLDCSGPGRWLPTPWNVQALPRSPPLLVLCAERRLRLDVCLLMAGLTAAEPLAPHSELPITAGCQQTPGGR